MTNVFFDASFEDETRRHHLYDGDLFVYSPRESTLALTEFARGMIEEAFAPRNPQYAQFDMGMEEFAAILGKLKPRFTNHPRAKELLQNILHDFGCDLHKVYFDVPKMRSMTSGDHLKAGIALAFDLHRDSWFASPLCQQNWWIPIYSIGPDDSLAFHPRYWCEPVRNGSGDYNQYDWNQNGRKTAAQFITSDTRKIPRPEQPVELDPQTRLITRPGGAILFSGAQMHSTVPNTAGRTRFSIDFRIVHMDDVINKRGAPNLDSAPTGTTLWELMRADDFSRMDESIIRLYDSNPPETGRVFEAEPVVATSSH
jgi:hypothetical protein